MTYRLLTLSTLTPLEPAGPLPAWLVAANPSDAQIADLGWSGRRDQGYWPIIVANDPPFDPDTHRLSDPVEGKPDAKTKTIPAVREVVALTADEIAARNPVPEQVSAAQATIILNDDGLLDRVDAIVAGMHRSVQLWYARANSWERNSPYVVGIGLMLGLSDADLDDKFRRAARRL